MVLYYHSCWIRCFFRVGNRGIQAAWAAFPSAPARLLRYSHPPRVYCNGGRRLPPHARTKEKVDKPQQDVVYWEHLEKRLYLCCLEMQAAVPFLEGGWGEPQIYFRKTGGADKCA